MMTSVVTMVTMVATVTVTVTVTVMAPVHRVRGPALTSAASLLRPGPTPSPRGVRAPDPLLSRGGRRPSLLRWGRALPLRGMRGHGLRNESSLVNCGSDAHVHVSTPPNDEVRATQNVDEARWCCGVLPCKSNLHHNTRRSAYDNNQPAHACGGVQTTFGV